MPYIYKLRDIRQCQFVAKTVVYKLGVLAHFVLWDIMWGYQHILSFKNQTRKIDKIHKDFELYQVFMYNICGKLS